MKKQKPTTPKSPIRITEIRPEDLKASAGGKEFLNKEQAQKEG